MSYELSIIVPTYNKRNFLELTLAALAIQTYPSDLYEVIIVDDGSFDNTQELVCSLDTPYKLTYIRQDNRGRSAARNVAIARATADTIMFLDDDRIMEPQCINEHMKLHQSSPDIAVAGVLCQIFAYMPLEPESRVAFMKHIADKPSLQYLACKKPFEMLLSPDDIKSDFGKIDMLCLEDRKEKREAMLPEFGEYRSDAWQIFITACVSVGKLPLQEVGLFDESFTGWGVEDWELGYRLHMHGLRFSFAEEAVTYHLLHPRGQQEEATWDANCEIACKKHPGIGQHLRKLRPKRAWNSSE